MHNAWFYRLAFRGLDRKPPQWLFQRPDRPKTIAETKMPTPTGSMRIPAQGEPHQVQQCRVQASLPGGNIATEQSQPAAASTTDDKDAKASNSRCPTAMGGPLLPRAIELRTVMMRPKAIRQIARMPPITSMMVDVIAAMASSGRLKYSSRRTPRDKAVESESQKTKPVARP